jgi:3-keto-5-aminohexanoate cleavage enzyme
LYEGAPTPVYRLMFSQTIAFGFPPASWALQAYLNLLDQEHTGAPWMVAGLGVELGELIEEAVTKGGHVRVGLEDSPMGCQHDNLHLLQQARRRIESAGGHLATASQVRERMRLN